MPNITQEEAVQFGMDILTSFMDILDKRLEELGRDTISREELHKIVREMRLRLSRRYEQA